MSTSSVFQREKAYFDQSPLDLTDHFCSAVNKSLVDAVDTFQVWVARNLVTFSKTQCKRVLATAAIGTAVSSKDIAHALREVLADSATAPAAAAAGDTAQAMYTKVRKRRPSATFSEDDVSMVTAGQLLEASANLGLDSTVGDISDIGIMLNVDVFRDIQSACDSLMSSLRQTSDKTCDKFELYLLNNVLRIPDDLHVPGLDLDEIQMEVDASTDGSSSSSSSSSSSGSGVVVRYTEEEERAIDAARNDLRDQIIRLRRRNARLARTQTDLHMRLERWQSDMMPVVESVAENVKGIDGTSGSDAEETTNLADAVQTVLRDAAVLSTTSADIDGTLVDLFVSCFCLCWNFVLLQPKKP
jgi:hypothetical protein